MERQDIIDKLLSAARQSEDAALAIMAGVALLRPQYDAALDASRTAGNEAQHDRAMELYCHAIENPRQAKRLQDEAVTFRAAAALLAESK